MNRISTWYGLVMASTLVVTLAGCSSDGDGGGGGGGDGITATLSGTGAKGIIQGGLVSARELDGSGDVLRNVGQATTDDHGDYVLTLADDYQGGPIELVLSAVAGTTMVCDVASGCGTVAFGQTVALDETFEMSAMLSGADDDDELTTHITPFTHMAAQRARRAATIDATTVDAANSEVSNLLGGLDILRLQPVDIADDSDLDDASSTEQIYSAMVSAIGRIAYEGEQSLEATIELLADSFAEGTMLAQDSGDPAAQISLQEIVDSVSDQLEALGLDDDSGVVFDLETDIANAVGNIIDPAPSGNAGDGDIELAKALVQDTRTWVTQLVDLEAPADSFATEVEMVDSITEVAFGALGASLGEAFELMVSTYVDFNGQAGTNDLSQTTENGTGTITVSIDGDIATVVFDGTLNAETVDITASFSSIGSSTSTVIATLEGSIANTHASLTTDGIDATLELSTPIVVGASQADAFAVDASSFSGQVVLAEAGVVDPVQFEGAMSLAILRFNDVVEDAFIPTQASLNGEISNINNSFAVNASATLDNADTYDPNAELSATNFPETTSSLSFTANLDGLPQAQIVITLNTSGYDETAVDEDNAWVVDAALTIAFGGVTLRLEFTEESVGETVTFTLVATNQDGVRLVFSVTVSADDQGVIDIGGTIAVAGEEVAELRLINDSIVRIDYDDDTFETLN